MQVFRGGYFFALRDFEKQNKNTLDALSQVSGGTERLTGFLWS